jgi:hypothetical protein
MTTGTITLTTEGAACKTFPASGKLSKITKSITTESGIKFSHLLQLGDWMAGSFDRH